MTNNIVLGMPYSGAFFWLLSAEEYYKKKIDDQFQGEHPYYKTLFGSDHHKILNETVSLSILYDTIYLPAADTFLPDKTKYSDDKLYHNKELGIISELGGIYDFEEIQKITKFLLNDAFIRNLLKEIPKENQWQIVWQAMAEIELSNKYDTTIMAVPDYLELYKKINFLINPSNKELYLSNSKVQTSAIDKLFEFNSLQFSVKGLDEYIFLRQSKAIKKYSSSFLKHVNELPNGELNKPELFKSMIEAINTSEIADKISGALSFFSTMTGFVAFIPAAEIAGYIGLGADLLSKVFEKYSSNNKWWLLGPELSTQLSKIRVEQEYKKIRQGGS